MAESIEGAPGALEPARALALKELVQYSLGSIVSRTLVDNEHTTVTAFAFDAGQALSEHSAPFAAYILPLDGEAELTIGGQTVAASVGDIVLMPANVPHALRARGRFKMLLLMARE
jgi:quercetin dioxygenase-like cupin family protein